MEIRLCKKCNHFSERWDNMTEDRCTSPALADSVPKIKARILVRGFNPAFVHKNAQKVRLNSRLCGARGKWYEPKEKVRSNNDEA